MSSDRVSRAASAAEQLCGALWETLRERAESGDARAAAELSRRLVEVCESFAAVAGAGLEKGAEEVAATGPLGSARAPEPRGGAAETDHDAAGAENARARAESPAALGDLRGVDEQSAQRDEQSAQRDEQSAQRDEPAQPTLGRREEGAVPLGLVEPGGRAEAVEPGPAREAFDPPHWSTGSSAALVDEYEAVSTPIEAKDVRASGHPPVTASLERRLERHGLDGVPFSVLLIEVLDVARLRALRATGDVLHEISSVESAIAEQLRPADTLLREIDGRWWLIAPDTDFASARGLAERLAGAARRFAHHGSPLQVVVGIAVCPDHGVDAATLIGHADIDLYAAQAAGRSIGGFDEDPSSPV